MGSRIYVQLREIMAGLIGTMAYLMITSIFQTISNIH